MYKLQRIDEDGTTLTLEFSGDVDIYQMRDNLRYFLLGSSYGVASVDLILSEDEQVYKAVSEDE